MLDVSVLAGSTAVAVFDTQSPKFQRMPSEIRRGHTNRTRVAYLFFGSKVPDEHPKLSSMRRSVRNAEIAELGNRI